MAEESDDDKTEAPTPHRLEKAREEGQVPRSKELTSLLILLVGVCIIWIGGESLARRLAGMLSAGLRFDHSMVNDPNLILGQIILLIKEAMIALLPLITGVVLVALISPVMLGGLIFSGKSLQPKFSKLNPLSGIKRMFSAQTGAELLKSNPEIDAGGKRGGILSLASLAGDDAPDGGISGYGDGQRA
ncbi:flagellar biosynthesis protein FlhB [Citrobacter koseri]|uniref:Flagellar biosynthetic protein FlhB n=1 Tax=Citrobacter koseri TaxID=545 RepID=A0A2X2VFA4_CITKO|nr:flagellar biosynthesis protein FlhB [Citrobacter koseri]